MKRISNFIFSISPKKLAIYLVLCPIFLFLLHTITTIIFRNLSETFSTQETLVSIILGTLFLLLAMLVLLWLLWLRSVVFSIEKSALGLSRRWFNIAFVLFIAYLLYNLCHSFIDYVQEDYRYIFYALNEFVGFGGLLIAYPTMCYYAARAVIAKKGIKPVTFLNALPFTLLLIFGTVISIPFLHHHFSKKTSKNSEIIIIYAIAFGLFAFILVLGFIAAITGLV